MRRSIREIALLSTASAAAALHTLPQQVVPPSAPVLEYETMPDGKVRIKGGGAETSPDERTAFAAQLEAIARRRQGDIDRIRAARNKQARKNARRAQSHG